MTWHPLPKAFRVHAASRPYSVLLETAKSDGEDDRSFLFINPIEHLEVWIAADLDRLLEDIESHLERGFFVAGHFSYECGESFVGIKANRYSDFRSDQPLARLGVFLEPIVFHHRSGTTTQHLLSQQSPNEEYRSDFKIHLDGLQITGDEYAKKIDRIHSYLLQGDTYQVNFTDRINGRVEAQPLRLFGELLGRQPVPFAAFLNYPGEEILSFSPELFFQISDGIVRARPMKGTWPRGRDIKEDAEAAEQLISDSKNRSEHIMIVDLLRNDLGRVCEWGSIVVDRLFQAERYSTLFQMTSAVSGRLNRSTRATEVFRTLFPSGSITGAPKRRTMEIIRELETVRRGLYTGAIGYFAPNGDASFNVAIRTLILNGRNFSMGVGGGITVGSDPQGEFRECQLKGSFLTKQRKPISLIETMRAEQGQIPFLQEHLKRLSASAKYFGIHYDQNALEAALLHAAGQSQSAMRVRLELSEDGQFAIACSSLDRYVWVGKLLLSSERTSSEDTLLRHKTTSRRFYDKQRSRANASGFDEVIFVNDKDQLTEGAITNIFLRRGDEWVTPPLTCGVLPGVQRGLLLKSLPNVHEIVCTLKTLETADEIIACNALRGVLTVASVQNAQFESLWIASQTLDGCKQVIWQ